MNNEEVERLVDPAESDEKEEEIGDCTTSDEETASLILFENEINYDHGSSSTDDNDATVPKTNKQRTTKRATISYLFCLMGLIVILILIIASLLVVGVGVDDSVNIIKIGAGAGRTNNNNSSAFVVVHNDDTTSTAAGATTMYWYEQHQQHGKDFSTQIEQWKKNNAERIISIDPNDNDENEMLNLTILAEEFRQVLATEHLILSGDSTTRTTFAALWCIMDDLEALGPACDELQAKVKEDCGDVWHRDGEVNRLCIAHAKFTNGYQGNLTWVPHWNIGDFPDELGDVSEHFKMTSRSVFFLGMPCLRNLWTPGAREMIVGFDMDDWPAMFDEMYRQVNEVAASAGAWYLGTPHVVVDDKTPLLEKNMINHYLKDMPLDPKSPGNAAVYKYYTKRNRFKLIPKNYTGMIPVVDPNRANHSQDDSLLDNTGRMFCEMMGLRHAPENLTILDVEAATVNRSDDTPDGKHYGRGLALARILALLLQVMKQIRR